MDLKFMEPQSRLIIGRLFGRNFEGFSDESRRIVNWCMLIGDIAAVYLLLSLL